MICEIMCIEGRNQSVDVDNDLSAHISGLQCTVCFITVLEKGVLLRTKENVHSCIPTKGKYLYQIITQSLKTYHLFL